MTATATTVKQGRYSGRMSRYDFWMRMIPTNVLFGLTIRLIDHYYGVLIEKETTPLIQELETSAEHMQPELVEEKTWNLLMLTYKHLLPSLGIQTLLMVLFIIISSPWVVKRMHDIGMSGNWYLLWVFAQLGLLSMGLLAPIVPFADVVGMLLYILSGLFILICGIKDSQYMPNCYGESPKYAKFYKLPQIPRQ